MKNLLTLIISTLLAAQLCAQNDWVELINGKDMTGWKASEHTQVWSVTEGGYLQAVGKRSHLFYVGEHLKDSFKNFEIEVQVRTFRLANSGIYIHTKFQESGWPNHGIEIQVNNSHIGEGDSIELKRMASLYGVRNMYKTFAKDDEWMTVKARVESNRIQIWLNGLKTVDYVQSERLFRVRRLSKGTFCLQGHDSLSKMQYRSFKVRRLPDDVRSDTVATDFGAWHDSLMVYQGRQFAFIDLNPTVKLPVADLAKYVYATGINVALVKTPKTARALKQAVNLPLFTTLKVNVGNQKAAAKSKADCIIGESSDVATAKTLLEGKIIQIWSDKGKSLASADAEILLELAAKNKVAIEINNADRYPSVEIIKMAKAKGCRFTFADLMPAEQMANSFYIVEAIRGADLNYKDLFVPKW